MYSYRYDATADEQYTHSESRAAPKSDPEHEHEAARE